MARRSTSSARCPDAASRALFRRGHGPRGAGAVGRRSRPPRPRLPAALRRPTAGPRAGTARCAAASQAVAEYGGALALQRAARPSDLARHIGHDGTRFKAVGDVVQLVKRPGRRLIRGVGGCQCGGQVDQRTALRACESKVGQRNTAVLQPGGGNAQQPGQRPWPKSQSHERFSTARVDERSGVRPGDDDAAGHPDEIHAAIREHADRLWRSVHHPRAFDELAQPRWRREFAVPHPREVTGGWATPCRRSRCPPQPACA